MSTYVALVGKAPHSVTIAVITGTRRNTRLQLCPAWAEKRRVLVNEIGRDLSPPAVVAAIVGGEGSRKAVVSFCSNVMLQKEAAEHIRRGEQRAPSLSDDGRRERDDESRAQWAEIVHATPHCWRIYAPANPGSGGWNMFYDLVRQF